MNEVIFYRGTHEETTNPLNNAVAILKPSENSLGEHTSRKVFFHTKMLYKIIKKDKRL
jgi:hypothetical protein